MYILDFDEQVIRNIAYTLNKKARSISISQEHIAEKMWISQTLVNFLLRGKKDKKHLETYLELAKVLWFSKEEFDAIFQDAKVQVAKEILKK